MAGYLKLSIVSMHNLLTILIVLIIAYPSFLSGVFWEDLIFIFNHEQITQNSNPLAFYTPGHIYQKSWPLGYTFFWGEFRLFGENFLIYKVLLILIHLMNFNLVKKLFYLIKIPYHQFAATLFLIHPLQVESVSWIFQQNTLLATTFCLLVINSHLSSQRNFSLKVILYFLLSILTKPYALCLPFILSWLNKTRNIRSYLFLILMFTLAILSVIVTIGGINASKHEVASIEYFNTEGDYTLTKTEGVIERVYLISKTFNFYIASFLLPIKRTLIHPDYFNNSIISNISLLIFLSITLLSAYIILKKRYSFQFRFLIFLFYSFYLPFSGLVYIPFMKFSYYSDRWAYTMVIPLCGLLALFINKIVGKLNVPRFHSHKFYIIFILFFLPASYLSTNYSQMFNDKVHLLLVNIHYNPQKSILYALLIKEYEKIEDYSKILYISSEAMKKFPEEDRFRYYFSKSREKLGL